VSEPEADGAFTLDHVVWESLHGPQAHFAQSRGQAARYPGDVSPFVALRPAADSRAWGDLGALFAPGDVVVLVGESLPAPPDWESVATISAAQMIAPDFQGKSDPESVRLTTSDVPEMLKLVERTKPGPFLPRTIELGDYFEIRREGVLVAMAGERMRAPGWTEISAVCTDDAYRGQGFGTRLVRAVAAGIRARGEAPLLHAAESNTNAIRLYESLGFSVRRSISFHVVRVPVAGGSGGVKR
jgi:ribosomal protein S18 acetylase RimI-like enzyme